MSNNVVSLVPPSASAHPSESIVEALYKEITREEAQVLHSLQLPFYYKYKDAIGEWDYTWTASSPLCVLGLYSFCVLEGEKICD